MEFIYLGKAKDLWKELAFMMQLENATGMVLTQYRPKLEQNIQN